jgi:ECF sigma factor
MKLYALNRLATSDPGHFRIVDMHFGGLSIGDQTYVLGISPATVKREWATARLWLQRELSRSDTS